jgi:gluconolactonase
MSWYPVPPVIETSVFTRLPQALRKPAHRWGRRDKAGQPLESFLEGPVFDDAGNLFVVDIAHGRIFRVDPTGDWHLVVEYDGEPNGLARHPDGRLFIADAKLGIMVLDPAEAMVKPFLTRRNGEGFKGVNDLILAHNGDLYFTDQGQTGLQDPTGRVYRLRTNGHLDCLIDNGPSPNGLVLSPEEDVLFVAMTRDNAVWRVPLMRDGGTTKVGRFASFHGTSGPDGLTVDGRGHLLIAHASLASVFIVGSQGEPVARLKSCAGGIVTNLAFAPGSNRLYITESESGTLMVANWPQL